RARCSAELFAKRCFAEPGPHRTPAPVTVPALRSGMKNAAPRPGHACLPRFASAGTTRAMADKPKKPQKLRARLPRGLEDRDAVAIAATRRMTEKIREVFER